MHEDDDPETPGWDAITAVFERLYPDQPNPPHAAAVPHWAVGGDDPLDGISFYRSRRERAHWHLVTYGFSELYAKREDDPETSGFGFELTFRIACAEGDEPPGWTVNLLQNLARYVFRSGNGLADGEHIDLNGLIFLQADTAITCVMFVTDPEAGRIDTPNGKVAFLQIVGVTKDELQAAQRWNTAGIAELLRERDPLLITDLSRKSLLADPEAQVRIERGSAADGSSCGLLFVDTVEVEAIDDDVCLTLGATGLGSVTSILPLRIPFDRGLVLKAKTGRASFYKGETSGIVRQDEQGLEIALTPDAARELAAALQVKAGEYRIAALPNLTIRVVPGYIRDKDGAVIETIG